MRTVISAIALLSGALLSATGLAQDARGNAGMQIANSGAPQNGVPACASCHGAKGEGNAASGFPRIAGQPKTYLAHQLAAYAGGSRNNAVMAPVAKALTQQQIDAVATYYATLPPAAPAASAQASGQDDKGDKGDKRGQMLAAVGDEKLGVQGCVNCHGPGGAGEAPTYPYLAGQHKSYLAAAMGEWKSGARNTDPSMQMNMIAKRLSDSDIAALAAYFSSQPPSQLDRGNTPAAAVPSAQGTQAGTAPVRGTGSEQGAATSGGSQGPGGGGAASGSGPSGTPK
ncbi:c-type cytochrome [Noviherbaspirillum autotrophicum]|uniref:c-type cytochrome n=1 Tax=Noviherbaspirillum autotrophicum TaxID=709839 RepID=UPI00069433F4|nr:c-type cytochrome [Noviherbaspirillum autotrophicum]